MSKPKILVLAFNRLKHDARITRQINFLKEDYDVHVFCFSKTEIDGVTFHEVNQTSLTPFRKVLAGTLLVTKQYQRAYCVMHNYNSVISKFRNASFDMIVANDVETLHMAFKIKNNTQTKILFDAHEYAPRHFEDRLWFKLFFQGFNTYFCKKYIPKIDAMTTVCDGLAEEYDKHFGVKPDIITNAPGYYDLKPQPTNPDRIRFIHMGIANLSRKLENMIDVINLLDDRFTLDLMLVTPAYSSQQTKSYVSNLKEKNKDNPKINIIDPVKSSEVVNTISKYDLGIFLVEPVNFNYTYILPNKLFEFIQARLAIAIGPSPEMAKIVSRYNIGVISEDFTPEALAESIKSLTVEDINKMKHNTMQAAIDLSSESNGKTLKAICSRLLSK